MKSSSLERESKLFQVLGIHQKQNRPTPPPWLCIHSGSKENTKKEVKGKPNFNGLKNECQ